MSVFFNTKFVCRGPLPGDQVIRTLIDAGQAIRFSHAALQTTPDYCGPVGHTVTVIAGKKVPGKLPAKRFRHPHRWVQLFHDTHGHINYSTTGNGHLFMHGH